MAAPSPLLKAAAFTARWSLALLLGAWLLAGAAWGLLHLAIVPRIGEFRPQLEAAASRALGVPVRIDRISAYSTGLIPAFEIAGLRLFDTQGREALQLPRVLVSLSPKSALQLQFDQVYVDAPSLDVRRAADGRVFVAGLALGGGPVDESMLDRFFSQPELAIRQGRVTWTDELRAQPPLELRDVDFVMRNAGRRHDFRFDATPPDAWGERFGLVARFEQPFLSMRSGDWRSWSGQLQAQFSHVDVSQLQRYADLGVDLQQGRGALRGWVQVQRAQATSATVDLALSDVVVGLDPGRPPLALAHAEGRLAGKYSPQEFDVQTRGLAFETADGLRWPGGNLRLQHLAAQGTRAAHGVLEADRLDLAALAQIADRLPLPAAVHAQLARHAPAGLVERLQASWDGPVDKLQRYEAKGRVSGLSWKAVPDTTPLRAGESPHIGTPGVQGAEVEFSLTERAGKASVVITDGSLEFPGVFEEPRVPMARFSGDLSWQVDGQALRVDLPSARFANADAAGEMQLRWHTSDPAKSSARARFPGVLDLQGQLERADGTRVFRYLPLLIDREVRHYVRDAVRTGVGSEVQFKVRGDLHDMPFANGRGGQFRIGAKVRDVTLQYVPRSLQAPADLPWPVLTQLSGELVFEGLSMRVRNVLGAVGTQALQISKAEATIPDMGHAPVLGVSAEARGPLPDMLVAVSGSPLAAMTQHALDAARATGPAELRLRLSVPLQQPAGTSVQGSVQLSGNEVQLLPDTPRFQRVRGAVNFSDSGFSLANMQARVLGGDVRLEGGTTTGTAAAAPAPAPSGAAASRSGSTLPAMQFRAQGTATVDALAQARELGEAVRVARFAAGSAAYTATLRVQDGLPEFSLQSNLQGLALNLPAPLGKPAETAVPLLLERSLVRDAAAGRSPSAQPARPQDRLLLELGRVASATYVRDIGAAVPQVLRGNLVVGEALPAAPASPPASSGVVAQVHLPAIDVDAWNAVLAQATAAGAPNPDPAAPPARGTEAQALGSYLPTRVDLRTASLSAGSRRLHNLSATVRRDGANWAGDLQADELAGQVQYRPSTEGGLGRVFARLGRLTLEQSSATGVEQLLDDQPTAIPALDVVVEDLQLYGKKLGRLEIEAVNRVAGGREGGVREWRLNRLNITSPEAEFRATGNWTALDAQSGSAPGRADAGRRTVMNFQFEIHDAGALLGRFGMPGLVRRGQGRMEGQVSWRGSPLGLDYPSMGGQFNILVEDGQFLKADPGLAKLLGVLSLQSLPRRLALDFSDVFSEGFSFDFFRGDVQIQQGVATTNNLQMKGVNAAVLMDGKADLARETQDIRVVVVPEINAGTASLIATAINPAVGLGSFLAQMFLRRPLIEAATQEFRVDGSWVDPRVTRIDRRATPARGANTPSASTP